MKRVINPGGTTTFVETMNLKRCQGNHVTKDDPISCHVELTIDIGTIMAALGAKALGNKSKRARALGGLISCDVTPF